MKKSPLIVFTGLALAAVAAVLGITRDRWMGEAPQQAVTQEAVTKTETAKTETAAPEVAAPAEVAKTAETPAAPAADQTAAAVTTAEEPAAPAVETTEVASNTASAEVEVTAPELKPTFDTVRVEKTGEAVIAGTAKAGSEVVVKLDGTAIGTAVANADGAFVVVPEKALPQGSGALTIESKTANETTAVKSDQSVAVIVPATEEKRDALVAVISPDQPTKVLQKPSAEVATGPVSLDAVDYDAAGNIVFNGRASPGAVVRLYVDNTAVGDAQAGTDGRWAFTGATAMTPGNHMLRVDAIDGAGKVTSRVELPFVREEQTKVAAATSTEQPVEQTTTTTTAEQTETAAATVTTETPAAETKLKDGRIVIQPGNNLWRISKVIYGSGEKYTVIFEANRDLIRDPDMIFPGQIFETPNVVPPEKIDPKQRDPIATTP